MKAILVPALSMLLIYNEHHLSMPDFPYLKKKSAAGKSIRIIPFLT